MYHFKRLVRFKDPEGLIYYGEAPGGVLGRDIVGKEVGIYEDPFAEGESALITPQTKKVAELLSPIPQAAHIYGVGLNYKGHVVEASNEVLKLPTPEYPLIFTKPVDALAGPFEDIPVDKECTLMDYEVSYLPSNIFPYLRNAKAYIQGEFCVIIGKDCKNLAASENPLDYVLGFCASNDVSCRYWQMPERGGQGGYAKGFDKFAPIGPMLVSPKVIPDYGSLTMVTKVNGEIRQSTQLNDLIFDVPTLIRHLSRAMTLRKFTVILTGTPSGVGALRKPPTWLKDRDIVTIKIDEIGEISNRMVFLT
ncbi:fumarylacetoacetate hydrolase family protein [Xylogone sp. PMI_703]|nr:fumarylacetoacetate hydrolase family protein [Xylogone sp. PMI_703]